MNRLCKRFWRDQRGEVSATSVILLYAILALGAIVGLVSLRNEMVQELGDIGVALRNLNQSFSVVFNGDTIEYDESDNDGSEFLPNPTDDSNQPPAGIEFTTVPAAGYGNGEDEP